jgi:putative flippase GtrA
MRILKTLIAFEAFRYAVNGGAATVLHYSVLRICLEWFHFPSAGLANFVGALFGISASFAGNRMFVFRRRSKPVLHQATRFILLYGSVACLHALLLFVWTDLWGLDYTIGFVIAIAVQVSASYSGNKYLVFGT